MKKIAIIIQKLRGGGAERVAANLSLAFSEKHEVHLIVFDGDDIKYPYGGTLHNLKIPPRKGSMGKLLNMLRRARAVRKVKRECHIDSSISLMEGANLVNVLSRQGETVITSVRVQMSKSRFSTFLSKQRSLRSMRFIAKRSQWVVALSEGVREDLIHGFGISETKLRTIYNHCDSELLLNTSRKRENTEIAIPEYAVTAMGRFTWQKGQWHLLRAFRRVVTQCPEARLILFGDGPLKDRLSQLTKELGLTEQVLFPGFVEAPHRYIAESKVFVFPSLFEGLGNVLVEAMSCGTPVIAADCYSGPREIIAPGTVVQEHLDEVQYAQYGILTSVGTEEHFNASDPLTKDEEQLAEAMIRILSDNDCREHYHQQALLRSKDFSPETILAQWEALL